MTARLDRLHAAAARSPLAAGVAAVVLLWAVLVGILASASGTAGSPAPAADAESATAPTAIREPASTIDAAESTLAALATLPESSADMRLHVPAVGIADAPVVPVALQDGGVLDPPTEVSDVGWWDGGAEPGADAGQTVLTGHTVHTGGGVMDDLDELAEGDAVRVTDVDGHVDYQVTEVVVWSKEELAEQAVEAFGQDRHHGRLVMVTCEDWDGGDYDSNVVVFAEPLTDA